MTLEELHQAYIKTKEKDEDYNYDNNVVEKDDNEFTILDNVSKLNVMLKYRGR